MSAAPSQNVPPTVRIRTLVLQGGRVEVSSPQLKEGEAVEVQIRRAGVTSQQTAGSTGAGDLLDWLDSIQPSIRTDEEWEEYEREFQRERDSWDR